MEFPPNRPANEKGQIHFQEENEISHCQTIIVKPHIIIKNLNL